MIRASKIAIAVSALAVAGGDVDAITQALDAGDLAVLREMFP